MLNMSYRLDWEAGMVNRNYHILKALIASGQYQNILSVDFLPFTTKKKIKVLIKAKPWKSKATTVYKSLGTRVDADSDNKTLYHMSSLNLKKLPEVLRRLKLSDDDLTIWSYNPLAVNALKDFPNAFKIFDAVDNWIEHPAYSNFQEELKQNYETISKEADLIFTVSEALLEIFHKKPSAYFIPNGVDHKHFSQQACDQQIVPQSDKPIIGYHGVIQSRINFSIIDNLAKLHPEYNFVFMGPVWKEVTKSVNALKEYENVNFLSPVHYNKLPAAIACFDVCIIPHQIDSLTESMNPLKNYEYLAAGKPIISTAVAGAEQFQDLMKLAVTAQDFSKKINEALAEDGPELIKRRQAMAASHSWQQRLEVMLKLIKENSQKSP